MEQQCKELVILKSWIYLSLWGINASRNFHFSDLSFKPMSFFHSDDEVLVEFCELL